MTEISGAQLFAPLKVNIHQVQQDRDAIKICKKAVEILNLLQNAVKEDLSIRARFDTENKAKTCLLQKAIEQQLVRAIDPDQLEGDQLIAFLEEIGEKTLSHSKKLELNQQSLSEHRQALFKYYEALLEMISKLNSIIEKNLR